MTPVGILPMARKSEVDRAGLEIEAARRRMEAEFLALGRAYAMPSYKHANTTDSRQFPNQ